MKTDLIEEAITEWWGERCEPDSDETGCPICDAWAQFDALNAAQANPQEKEPE